MRQDLLLEEAGDRHLHIEKPFKQLKEDNSTKCMKCGSPNTEIYSNTRDWYDEEVICCNDCKWWG